jgi:hypothetical protein
VAGVKLLSTRLMVWFVLSVLGSGVASSVTLAQSGAEEENLIKAAFVYNFAKFTLWPDKALGAEGRPMSMCIAGEDDLTPVLMGLRGKLVKGHPISVRTYLGTSVPRSCNLLYVAASEQTNQFELIKSVSGLPILTVSQLPRFAGDGGIIELFHKDGRIRFIINLGVARKAGLEISPSLLNLAEVVGIE